MCNMIAYKLQLEQALRRKVYNVPFFWSAMPTFYDVCTPYFNMQAELCWALEYFQAWIQQVGLQ
jgi:hypothetical protein